MTDQTDKALTLEQAIDRYFEGFTTRLNEWDEHLTLIKERQKSGEKIDKYDAGLAFGCRDGYQVARSAMWTLKQMCAALTIKEPANGEALEALKQVRVLSYEKGANPQEQGHVYIERLTEQIDEQYAIVEAALARTETGREGVEQYRIVPALKFFNPDQASGFYTALDLITGKTKIEDILEQPKSNAAIPEGMALVPIEPEDVEEILEAGEKAYREHIHWEYRSKPNNVMTANEHRARLAQWRVMIAAHNAGGENNDR